MKFLILMCMVLSVLSFNSFAGFEGKNDGDSKGIYNKLNCKGGVECSKGVNGNFDVVALAIFDYDFTVSGGAIGAYDTGVTLPAKAVIEKCWFRVETQLVDAGAGTLAVSCEDANNILSAADQTGVAAGAFLASAVTGAAAAMVDDIAEACNINFTIAGAALSAGKIRGYCRYTVHE